MSKLSLLIVLFAPFYLLSQSNGKSSAASDDANVPQINWVGIDELQQLVKKEPRKILIDVYTKWCGPCKMMSAKTFTNPDVIKYVNENFYAVKFDAESPDEVKFHDKVFKNPTYDPNKTGRNGVNEFSRYMRVTAYPTILYLDENLQVLSPVKGYQTPKQIELYLKFFAQEDYKDLSNEGWIKYQEDFVPAFTE